MSQPIPNQLLAVGWSDRVQALFATLVDLTLVPARVVGVDRGWCRVVTSTSERSLPIPGLAVGDWVGLDDDQIGEVLPRWSVLGRLGPEGERQALAVNIDLVLITAPADRLSLSRVEREMVMAWDSGARPVVVLTKLDLAPPGLADQLTTRLGTVDVVETSSLDGSGLDELRVLLVPPLTAALLGPSGAGKSTLINALLGENRLGVGAVRDEDGRGRHTTSSRQLVSLPSGGSLVDMPGLRSLGTDASEEAVAAAFPDIDELAANCRFSDCAHEVEPGCAVTEAAAGGGLDPARLASYQKLLRETAFERWRTDPLAHAEEARIWKARTKANRKVYRDRDRDR
ncbi:MAG TPA: ribosome small subunit-dependent GTPase A [Acidimicrobiales bacterium]